ncbi:hypothetical protein K431DRAFT_226198 [Polychaeton citri CBS 116435]|uniref:Guanine nucleotide-exchange factor SEC12 n=1 Tax=Polychaeton citri CBS 116435 TaxID=1314669 RepID=A0A9P4ULW1_9PEZI|nr:hypothetical protein K431DRAFT_226198 [Polychaeton citri CBS 116435]
MAPPVSFTKTSLPYPIFAADFDPYNRGYLIVGGGGGESKTGVPNQISVLDISNRASTESVAEIELSRNEDSVQSLANLSTPDGLIIFAGVNSSRADQDKGTNEHLRSFSIKYPPRKKQKTDGSAATDDEKHSSIDLLGKRSVFRACGPKLDTYQRLLKLSPARRREGGGKRIGAIATGFAGDRSEIVVFNATVSTPGTQDIICRIDLPAGTEAEDLDITDTQEGAFSLVYCTSYSIHEQTIEYDFDTRKAKLTPKGSRRVFQIPEKERGVVQKDKFRALRFLDPENVIALINKANKQGAVLQTYHLYPTGPASLLNHLDKTMPSRIKQASGLDVALLDTDKKGNRQVVVAVAGQDISVEVLTSNFSGITSSYAPLKRCIVLKDVHDHQMTKILFAPFHSPARKEFPPDWTTGHPGPQYLRLASTSYGNTVVVDTFPLQPLEPSNRDTRYVLVHPSSIDWGRLLFMGLLSFIVIVIAIVAQNMLYPSATTSSKIFSLDALLDSSLGSRIAPIAQKFAPRREVASQAASVVSTSIPSAIPGSERLRSLLQQQQELHEEGIPQAVVLKETGGSDVEHQVHSNVETALEQDVTAKHWHQLSEEQKGKWKDRLANAGHWMEHEGEAVLKGVLFSEYAGLVGQLVADF